MGLGGWKRPVAWVIRGQLAFFLEKNKATHSHGCSTLQRGFCPTTSAFWGGGVHHWGEEELPSSWHSGCYFILWMFMRVRDSKLEKIVCVFAWRPIYPTLMSVSVKYVTSCTSFKRKSTLAFLLCQSICLKNGFNCKCRTERFTATYRTVLATVLLLFGK